MAKYKVDDVLTDSNNSIIRITKIKEGRCSIKYIITHNKG